MASKVNFISHNILTKHIKDLHILAQALIEYETLSGAQINSLLAGKGIVEGDLGPSKIASVEGKKTKQTKVVKKHQEEY